MDFKAENTSVTYANAVRNLFEVALHKTESAIIVERSQMDAILMEQGFQLSGCTDSTCAVEVGKLLSANYVLIGTLNKLESFTITIRLVNVTDGKILLADSESTDKEKELKNKIDILAGKLAGELSKQDINISETVKLEAPKNFMASNGEYRNKITLKWEPVKDADSYYIFRSNEYSGNYTMIKKIKKTAFEDTDVEISKKYYYKIRAGQSEAFGPFSGIKEGMSGKSKPGYYIRNIFLPGFGQHYYGNYTKSYFFMGSFAVTGALAGYSYYFYTKKQREYDKLKYGTNQSDIDKKYNAAEKAALYTNIALGIVGAVYVFHWIDALFFTSPVYDNETAIKHGKVGAGIYFRINSVQTMEPGQSGIVSEKRYELGVGVKF